MPKLRKMLGRTDSQECIALMRLIETQSHSTLARWAVEYAKHHYLWILKELCPEETRLENAVDACEVYFEGGISLRECKAVVKSAGQAARETEKNPVAQAAARAVATACATVQTPTNALGFLFYGAAAVAYRQSGLEQTAGEYDKLASAELARALRSLRCCAATGEKNPVHIKWNC